MSAVQHSRTAAEHPVSPALRSRLPQVGTTIFTVMSALAQQCGAINLGQGFPDFDPDPKLPEAVNTAMRAGHNQYPPMAGVPLLREALAEKIEALHGAAYDPGEEITITAGATQALLTAVLAVVHPGDEVIVLTPAYDSYAPAIALAGGVARFVPLDAHYRPDFDAIAAAITPRTRAMLVNSPHNPSGRVWTAQDMQRLGTLLAPTDIVLISDEVYEHMVFDGATHHSAAAYPQLAARSFVVSSFGKTYHVTGWKVGMVAAPRELTREFRKVHQFNVFTVNTPMQHGLAHYLRTQPEAHLNLPAFYQAKRDRFRAGLASTRLRLLPCEGTYFQCADYGAVSDLPEAAFCEWLTREVGVAAIPLSAFHPDPVERSTVRFCFAKREATLDAALERLARL
ncbi:MAG: pyridoxal phosphate-dependent aminotransferase [Betaproteobacteria bacterium]|jgi:methionine aminotransferase|nr:pyridoxal phosphate-dependent aminotransferase [Betaproteobacteria bacterium]OZB45383.1 MAG: methionine aminotransferase [Thiomonas sp. 15-66-11]OZB63636.1 MAG: methionine aminotransferase [Thiomonas sp. 13-66-29]